MATKQEAGPKADHGSPFGDLLKLFRVRMAITQLQLADMANTTARHLSFLENGRSRPKQNMVSRLAKALALSPREHNELLIAAGLPTNHLEFERDARADRFLVETIERQLGLHEPYPACVADTHSRIQFANTPFKALFLDLISESAEESIDAFFGNEKTRKILINWDEIAQAFYQRRIYEASRTGNQELRELSARTKEHLKSVASHPDQANTPEDSMVMFPLVQLGEQRVSFYMTVLRFESIQQCALSNLRMTMLYPVDETNKRRYLQGMQAILPTSLSREKKQGHRSG